MVSPAKLEAALRIASRSPGQAAWAEFLGRVLLIVGAALVLSGLIYLVAFNWAELHRFAKFGLCAAWVATGAGVAAWFGLRSLPGQVGLTAGAVGVGAYIAVIGQVYQTGADWWGLFAWWALFAAPWVVAGLLGPRRVAALVLLEVVLIDATLGFWGGQVRPELYGWLFLAAAGVHAAATAGWWGLDRLRGAREDPWVPRVLLATTFAILLIPTVMWIGGADAPWSDGLAVGGLVLGAACGGTWAFTALTDSRDQFPPTAAAAAALIAANTALGRLLLDVLDLDALGFLVLSVAIVAQAAGFVAWIRLRAPRLGETDEEVA